MHYDTAAWAMIGLGTVGIIAAVVMSRYGYGKSMVGAVSKGSRLALRRVTRRWRKI